MTCRYSDLGIVLSGGGARAAYQVGVLQAIARRRPNLHFPIIAGVSAGAINAAFLATSRSDTLETVQSLAHLWSHLETGNVFDTRTRSLTRMMLQWGNRILSGSAGKRSQARGFVDTDPLRLLLATMLPHEDGRLVGIRENLEERRLQAVALTALNYSTGQTITWVQGSDIEVWERPNRRSQQVELTIEHVMASSALPLFFPAIRIGNGWFGDGGVRLAAPLSPALHLGARRVLAVSTRYERSFEEADVAETTSYPAPAQILGQLMKAIFIDLVDQDVHRLERLNHLLKRVDEEERLGLKLIDLLVIRPSVDLGRLAAEFEPELPRAFRFLARGLGSKETESPDFLSILMFQPGYLRRLIEIGEADAEARMDELLELLDGPDALSPAAEAESIDELCDAAE